MSEQKPRGRRARSEASEYYPVIFRGLDDLSQPNPLTGKANVYSSSKFHSGVITRSRSLTNIHVSSGRPHPNLFGSAPVAVSTPNVIQGNTPHHNLPDVSTTTSTISPEPPIIQSTVGTQTGVAATAAAGTQAGVATAEGGSQTPPPPVTTDIGTQTDTTDINKVKDPKFDKLINLMLGFYGTPQKHVNEAAPRRTLDYTTIARPPMPAPVRSRLDIVKSHPNNILDISPPKCTIGLTTDNVFQHGGLAT